MDVTYGSGLLERDDELRLLAYVTEEAADRRGAVVLVSGEAGIGKSSLLDAWLEAAGRDARVLRCACDDLAAPRPLGALRDLRGVGPRLREALREGDALTAAEALLEELENPLRPDILAIEDVHWADDATLDVIRFVGRRIDRYPAILALTYRDDELGAGHPLQSVLGVLAGDRVFRVGLRRLSVEAIARLVAGQDPLDPDEVAVVTAGNPFFVAEVIAEGAAEVPRTVADSVLGRLSKMSPPTREAVGLLSVEPGGVESALLDALLPDAAAVLGPAEDRGLFRSDDDGRVRFRHELVRRAVADQLAPTQRGRHHRRWLTVLLEHRPQDVARVLHHAAGADDADVLAERAPAAAREAFDAGAHRQAVAYEELALRHEDLLPVEDRAALWEQHAWSLHYLHRSAEAPEAAARALALRRRAGDEPGAVRSLTTLATMRFMANDAEGGAADFARAAELVGAVDDPAVRAEFAVLRLTVGHLRGEHATVLAEGGGVIEDVERAGRSDLALLARIYHTGSRVLLGEDEGLAELADAIERAHGRAPVESIARGHLRLGAYLVMVRRWAEARERLERAVGFFDDHGFRFHRHLTLGHLAHVLVEQADWDRAREVLEPLLDDVDDAGIAAAVPLHAAALLAMRTGEDRAGSLVQAAWDIGLNSRTAEHLVRSATAMLEWAWLEDASDIVDEVAEPALAASRGTVSYPMVLWHLALNGREVSGPDGPALDPECLSLDGQHDAAATAWEDLGMPFQHALELVRSDDVEVVRRGLEALIAVDAHGAVRRVRRRLRELGARHVPYGPQAATRTNPAGLTTRQLEVLELVADGLTNAEIAERLVLSVRTVDHHVSAVLQKLDAPDREVAAQRATDLGIVPREPDGATGRGSRLT